MTVMETPVVESKSLLGDNQAAHINPDSVAEYLELAKAGVVPVEMNNPCQAVQNNVSLRHDTRVTL